MRLTVEGMTCDHCVRAITRAVAALGGTAHVDLAAKTVAIEGDVDEAAARAAIEEEGYTVMGSGAAPEAQAFGSCCGTCHT